jgi:osmotically-inducible protein OsmY
MRYVTMDGNIGNSLVEQTGKGRLRSLGIPYTIDIEGHSTHPPDLTQSDAAGSLQAAFSVRNYLDRGPVMPNKDPVSDRAISQRVSQQLQNRGMRAPCQIAVNSHKGTVTLSGKIQYDHQRRIVMQAVQGVSGVQRVVDRLQLIARESHWK